ncbi:protein phosphatase 1M [Protopterus annectens]|uniref:protein phosphatase 1M n=1 Tax=Protopterus annectens TaxID=7888 RepID=UPI001CFB4586|nr:protein phosphatase 1M [Protopterus annectens]
MKLIIEENESKQFELGREIDELDKCIKTDLIYGIKEERDKYFKIRRDIDGKCEGIIQRKIGKLNRDINEYESNTSYPKPVYQGNNLNGFKRKWNNNYYENKRMYGSRKEYKWKEEVYDMDFPPLVVTAWMPAMMKLRALERKSTTKSEEETLGAKNPEAVQQISSRFVQSRPPSQHCAQGNCLGDIGRAYKCLTKEYSENDYIRCYYWALFDGHGGHMASLMASEYLHRLIKVQLQEIMPAILSDVPPVHLNNTKVLPNDQSFVKDKHISMEQVVIGALEHAFQQCDDLMSVHMNEPGGCTALVVLSLQGRLYIANAGDSRAVLVEKSNVTQLTRDLTAENERQRIQQMAFTYPQLLGNEFTRYEFPRRLMKQEVGKKVLYRDYFMTGWGYKLIEDDDQKYPLIHGHGRQTRIMGTLAVSRCFGNHKLKVFDTNILVKPFLSCIPEVKMVAFSELPTDVNDVLIVATDGLWDVISNKEVGEIVRTFLSDNSHEPQRFSLLAEHLVSKARGTQNGYEWTQENGAHASYDDISVFVIPLCNRESS